MIYSKFQKFLNSKSVSLWGTGPWGNLPYVGYLPFLFFKSPLKVFAVFKEKYGKIFSLKLGGFRYFV